MTVSNFAMTWETAKVKTFTRYRAGINQNANVTIGVSIGFRGVNITLQGKKDEIVGETINYNENFNWQGMQGRAGFGPFAGQFNKQFRAAQLRGLPLPILSVAEYFTIDGEGIRWGRFYRQAGWYSHIALWLAFPLWILSNILFLILLRYGAYFLALTGLSMVITNVIWVTLRNPTDLRIPFTLKDVLVFSYGSSFWACLITGIVCIVLAIVVFLMDKLFPAQTAVFFNVDVLQDSENIVVEDDDEVVTEALQPAGNNDAVDSRISVPAIQEHGTDEDDDEEGEGLYRIPPTPVPKFLPMADRAGPSVIRVPQRKPARTSELRLTKRLQRPRRRDPPPRPNTQEEDTNVDNQTGPSRLFEARGSAQRVAFSPTHAEPSVSPQRVTFGARQFLNPVAENEFDGVTNIKMTGFEQMQTSLSKD